MIQEHHVYLGRHGECEDNFLKINPRPNSPLTERGKRQAQASANRLAALGNIGAIYSSYMTRARETAEIVRDTVHPDLDPNDFSTDAFIVENIYIRERNMGAITGMTAEETDRYGMERDLEYLTTPSGKRIYLGVEREESFGQAWLRAKDEAGYIRERILNGFENPFYSTHGTFKKLILAALMGISWEEAVTTRSVPNASITKITFREEETLIYFPPPSI